METQLEIMIFIKWQLEIIPMDNTKLLNNTLHWIPKITFIPTACNIYKIKPANCLPKNHCFIFNSNENNRIWIINFYV